MKKIFTCLFALCLGFGLFGCASSNNQNADGKVDGSLEEIMTKLYEDIDPSTLPAMIENTPVTKENEEWFLGTTDLPYEEALASESQIGSVAHSVVLVRAKEGEDPAKMMDQIKSSINTHKWVCVGIEDDQLVLDRAGNLILVAMNAEHGQEFKKKFDSLKK